MSDVISVTSRRLCGEEFLTRLERIAAAHPAGILLREKDLTGEEYRSLAKKALRICEKWGTPCILHGFPREAEELGAQALHLPLSMLKELPADVKKTFRTLGASCHSAAEAKEAEKLGCTYVTAGHIFETDCKKGLPGRGLPFLREVCESVSIPVYAIGGISPENAEKVREAGAEGLCVMSGLMRCGNVEEYLRAFEKPEETSSEKQTAKNPEESPVWQAGKSLPRRAMDV